jgi:hypothetical protein
MLERLSKFFAEMGHPAIADSGWNDFDLAVKPDAWTRIEFRTADEEHSGMKLKNIVAARVRLSKIARAGLTVCALSAIGAASAGLGMAAFVLGAITAGAAICALSEVVETGRIAYRAIEQCASELNLAPLGRPTVSARRAAALGTVATAKPENSAEAVQLAGR